MCEPIMHNSEDRIQAVFVTAFDPIKGNIVEWKYPPEAQLPDGIEFASIPSGLHSVTRDTIYFSRPQRQHGVACFHNAVSDRHASRGVEMRAVGVIASRFDNLHHHTDFLTGQVERLVTEHDQVRTDLIRYYEASQPEGSPGDSGPVPSVQPFRVEHPLGGLANFVETFGPAVFVLWRHALLGKRILHCRNPPLYDSCARVYCTALLTATLSPRAPSLGDSRGELRECSSPYHFTDQPIPTLPSLFCVTLRDIPALTISKSYVACTSDRILESKPIYDLFIMEENTLLGPFDLKTGSGTRNTVKVTRSDIRRYEALMGAITKSRSDAVGVSHVSQLADLAALDFFRTLNSGIVTGLLESPVSRSRPELGRSRLDSSSRKNLAGSTLYVSAKRMKRLDMDPVRDAVFIRDLVKRVFVAGSHAEGEDRMDVNFEIETGQYESADVVVENADGRGIAGLVWDGMTDCGVYAYELCSACCECFRTRNAVRI